MLLSGQDKTNAHIFGTQYAFHMHGDKWTPLLQENSENLSTYLEMLLFYKKTVKICQPILKCCCFPRKLTICEPILKCCCFTRKQ